MQQSYMHFSYARTSYEILPIDFHHIHDLLEEIILVRAGEQTQSRAMSEIVQELKSFIIRALPTETHGRIDLVEWFDNIISRTTLYPTSQRPLLVTRSPGLTADAIRLSITSVEAIARRCGSYSLCELSHSAESPFAKK